MSAPLVERIPIVMANSDPRVKLLWQDLVRRYGSPFHSLSFTLELTRNQPGLGDPTIHILRGNQPVGLVSFEDQGCARLAYYRSAVPPVFDLPAVMSHSLTGTYGYPLGPAGPELEALLDDFTNYAYSRAAVALFLGIPQSRPEVINTLLRTGYVVERCQTAMVRRVNGPSEDLTAGLRQRDRARVRNRLSVAGRAGLSISLVPDGEQHSEAPALIRGVLEIDTDLTASVYMPPTLLENILSRADACEVLLASLAGKPVGVHANFHWGDRYYIWQVGHDHGALAQGQQSHALYEASSKRTRSLGCSAIDAGRSPYRSKREHGFEQEPVYFAANSRSESMRNNAHRWLRCLSLRHESKYGELIEPRI